MKRKIRKEASIITSALDVFSKKGFYNTSISDIAKNINISVGNIYNYFPSKKKLARASISLVTKKLASELKEINKQEISTEDKILKFVKRYFEFTQKHPEMIEYFFKVYLSNRELFSEDESCGFALAKEFVDEVGTLSRAMLNKTLLIKDAHRKYKDSLLTRILARVCEIPQLLNHSKELIKELNLDEPSFTEPKIDISKVTATGTSAVEAARGSLIHKVNLENGIIKKYDIITPTQWNLSNGTKDNLATSQKAMIGLQDIKVAELVFKSFDVCSVCTTH